MLVDTSDSWERFVHSSDDRPQSGDDVNAQVGKWLSEHAFFVYRAEQVYNKNETYNKKEIDAVDGTLSHRIFGLNNKINKEVIEAIKKLPQELITADLEQRVSADVINTLMPQIKAMIVSVKQEIIDELGK